MLTLSDKSETRLFKRQMRREDHKRLIHPARIRGRVNVECAHSTLTCARLLDLQRPR